MVSFLLFKVVDFLQLITSSRFYESVSWAMTQNNPKLVSFPNGDTNHCHVIKDLKTATAFFPFTTKLLKRGINTHHLHFLSFHSHFYPGKSGTSLVSFLTWSRSPITEMFLISFKTLWLPATSYSQSYSFRGGLVSLKSLSPYSIIFLLGSQAKLTV